MSPEPRQGGSAVAPDLQPTERADAAEILKHGPQPPLTPEQQKAATDARVASVIEMQRRIAEDAPPPPDLHEKIRQVRSGEHKVEGDSEPEVEPDPPMSQAEARDALSLMLSVDSEPDPDIDHVKIERLSRQFNTDFYFTVRGLNDEEWKAVDAGSVRESTTEERKRGFANVVSDPSLRDRLMVAKATLSPDLKDKRLRRYGSKPEEVLTHWLNPGETTQVAAVITELSGFSDSAVVRAKKS